VGLYKSQDKTIHRQPRPEKGLWYQQPGSLKGLDASTSTEKRKFAKKKTNAMND
jgi:hypothetical protein